MVLQKCFICGKKAKNQQLKKITENQEKKIGSILELRKNTEILLLLNQKLLL